MEAAAAAVRAVTAKILAAKVSSSPAVTPSTPAAKSSTSAAKPSIPATKPPTFTTPNRDNTKPEESKKTRKAGKSRLSAAWGPEDLGDTDAPVQTPTNKLPTSKKSGGAEGTPSKTGDPIPKSTDIHCPICLGTPLHVRYRCPLVIKGSNAIEKRLTELRKDESTIDSSSIVHELEEMLKKMRKKEASNSKQSNVNADSTSSPLLPSNRLDDIAGASSSSAVVNSTTVQIQPIPSALDSRLSSWKPVIPKGSRMSEVTVESRDEGSSNDSSSSDSDDEDDETSKSKAPDADTVGIFLPPADSSPYANVDLEALVRGPSTPRISLADVLPTSDSEDDEDKGEESDNVVLEEDDDLEFRRRSKKFERVVSSDDEVEEEPAPMDVDVGVGVEDTTSVSPDPALNLREQSEVRASLTDDGGHGHVSFQDVNELGSSAGVDPVPDVAVTDAFAADIAVFDLMNEDSEGSTRVAPSAENGDETDGSNVASGDKDLDVSRPQDDAASGESVPAQEGGSKSTAPVLISIPTNTPVPVPIHEESSIADSHTATDAQNESGHEETDPIEPADDLLEPRGPSRHTSPIETDQTDISVPLPPQSQSTPKAGTGVVRRMRKRNGEVSTGETDLPVPAAVEETVKRSMTLRNDKLKTQQDGQDTSRELEQSVARRTRNSSRALTSMPPPALPEIETPAKKKRRPNRTAEEKAAEAAAKEERARLRAEKAAEKAAAKKASQTAKKKATPSDGSAITPASAAPPATPSSIIQSQSLDTWTTLTQSSPHAEPESSLMVDQLQSSSPSHSRVPSPVEEHPAHDQFDPADTTLNADRTLEANPLFILTESQPPFPYSQWAETQIEEPEDDEPLDDHKSASPTEDEEDEVASTVDARPKSASTASSYRRLTDIASQHTLFSTPVSSRPAFAPVVKGKLNEMYGKAMEDEDDDDDESGSDSDSDAEETSHIPKSRRAGTNAQRK